MPNSATKYGKSVQFMTDQKLISESNEQLRYTGKPKIEEF